MRIIEGAGRVALAGAVAAIVGAAAGAPAASAAQAASAPQATPAKSCNTAAQVISERKRISCAAAKEVFLAVRNRALDNGARIPECRGEMAIEFVGWRVTAAPVGRGGPGIGTRYKKGRQSFRVSGGGAC